MDHRELWCYRLGRDLLFRDNYCFPTLGVDLDSTSWIPNCASCAFRWIRILGTRNIPNTDWSSVGVDSRPDSHSTKEKRTSRSRRRRGSSLIKLSSTPARLSYDVIIMKYSKIIFFLFIVTGSFVHAITYTRFILRVDEDGDVVLNVNDTNVSKEAGSTMLKRLAKLSPEQTIKVYVDPEVQTKDLCKFITQVQDAGLQNIEVIILLKSDDESNEMPKIFVLKVLHDSSAEQRLEKIYKNEADW